MSDDTLSPYEPARIDSSPRNKPAKVRWMELGIVSVLILLLLALLTPMRRSSPEAARRMVCSNNMRQIAIALLNYEAIHHVFPPAYTVDADGRPLHSWRVLLLPYLEQQELYDKIDLTKPWDHPANAAVREQCPTIYRCRSLKSPAGTTSYLAVSDEHGFMHSSRPRLRDEITDEAGATIVVLEVKPSRSVPWMQPSDIDIEDAVSSIASEEFAHRFGYYGGFHDGSIRFLPKTIASESIRAMLTIDGHESIPESDLE